MTFLSQITFQYQPVFLISPIFQNSDPCCKINKHIEPAKIQIIAFAEKCFSFFNRYQECTSRFEISKKLKIASYLLFQSPQISPLYFGKVERAVCGFLEAE